MRSGERGQASVELVAMVPFVALLAVVVMHVLAVRGAADLAEHAAAAGARALGRGADPRAAVQDALPEWPEQRITVRVVGRRVTVTLRPKALLRSIGERLATTARADAGPAATGNPQDWDTIRGGDGTSGKPDEEER